MDRSTFDRTSLTSPPTPSGCPAPHSPKLVKTASQNATNSGVGVGDDPSGFDVGEGNRSWSPVYSSNNWSTNPEPALPKPAQRLSGATSTTHLYSAPAEASNAGESFSSRLSAFFSRSQKQDRAETGRVTAAATASGAAGRGGLRRRSLSFTGGGSKGFGISVGRGGGDWSLSLSALKVRGVFGAILITLERPCPMPTVGNLSNRNLSARRAIKQSSGLLYLLYPTRDNSHPCYQLKARCLSCLVGGDPYGGSERRGSGYEATLIRGCRPAGSLERGYPYETHSSIKEHSLRAPFVGANDPAHCGICVEVQSSSRRY